MKTDDLYRLMENIHEKVALAQISMAKLEVLVNQNTLDVQKHMARSDNLEKQVNILQDEILEARAIARGQAKVFKVASIVLGSVATLVGLMFSLGQLFQVINQ